MTVCFYALFYAILVQVTEVVYSQNSKKQKCTLNTQMMHLITKKLMQSTVTALIM